MDGQSVPGFVFHRLDGTELFRLEPTIARGDRPELVQFLVVDVVGARVPRPGREHDELGPGSVEAADRVVCLRKSQVQLLLDRRQLLVEVMHCGVVDCIDRPEGSPGVHVGVYSTDVHQRVAVKGPNEPSFLQIVLEQCVPPDIVGRQHQ